MCPQNLHGSERLMSGLLVKLLMSPGTPSLRGALALLNGRQGASGEVRIENKTITKNQSMHMA